MYLLSGDNNELGSTQNPTYEWKTSRISIRGCSRIIAFKNRENWRELARCSFVRMVWAWERQTSACGPRTPSKQPCGQPRCFNTLITQFIMRLWAVGLPFPFESCLRSCWFIPIGESCFFPVSDLLSIPVPDPTQRIKIASNWTLLLKKNVRKEKFFKMQNCRRKVFYCTLNRKLKRKRKKCEELSDSIACITADGFFAKTMPHHPHVHQELQQIQNNLADSWRASGIISQSNGVYCLNKRTNRI